MRRSVHCRSAHHPEEGVVHVPFPLLEVIWYHRRHGVGAVGMVTLSFIPEAFMAASTTSCAIFARADARL